MIRSEQAEPIVPQGRKNPAIRCILLTRKSFGSTPGGSNPVQTAHGENGKTFMLKRVHDETGAFLPWRC